MATRYTIQNTGSAGSIADATNWNGGVALPEAGDDVQIKHAMTVDGAAYARFPAVGAFASLDCSSTGGAAPALVVTGTVEIAATVVTGVGGLKDSGVAAVLTVTAPGGATTLANQQYHCYTTTTFTGNITGTAAGTGAVYTEPLSVLTAVTIIGTSTDDYGVDNNGTIVGNVIGVGGGVRDGVYNNAGCTITGDVTGTSDSDSGVYTDGDIVGDVVGVSSSAEGVLCDGAGTITGSVTGVSTTGIGVHNVGTITGDITGTGNSGAGSLGVYNTGTLVADNIVAQATDAQAFWTGGGTLTEGAGAAGVNLIVRRLDGGQAVVLDGPTISDELNITYVSNSTTPLVI